MGSLQLQLFIMESVKKYLVAVIVLFLISSCSQTIRIFDLESVYLQKNKGKEQNLVLEITIPNDTIFAEQETQSKVTVVLKYFGDGFYYFNTSPQIWRMDGGIATPNSFLRTFFHNNEECRVREDLLMRNDINPKYCNYLLRSGKSMVFEEPFDLKRLICKGTKFDTENHNYGEYQVQLSYITIFGDTICSNIVNLWYVEK